MIGSLTASHRHASVAVCCRCCQALSCSASSAEFVHTADTLHCLRMPDPLPSPQCLAAGDARAVAKRADAHGLFILEVMG